MKGFPGRWAVSEAIEVLGPSYMEKAVWGQRGNLTEKDRVVFALYKVGKYRQKGKGGAKLGAENQMGGSFIYLVNESWHIN